MTQMTWIAVSVVVAVGAAIAVSGVVGRRIKRQTRTGESITKLDMTPEGLRRTLTMDAARTMPIGKDQIKYSARRAVRKYSRDQELQAEEISPDMKIINKGLSALARRKQI